MNKSILGCLRKEWISLSLTISLPPKGYQVSFGSGTYVTKWLPPHHFLRSKGKCPSLTQSQSSHIPIPVTKRGRGRGRRQERGESLPLRPPTSHGTTPAARKSRIRTGGSTLTLVNNNVEDGPLGTLLTADVPFQAASVVC